MKPFRPGGPARYQHQRAGLAKVIATKGICALLFDPGTGKTATALDYASLLALKSPTGEARVLVVAPLAAVDTWVDQAGIFVSPEVAVWAEAVGGSIKRRASVIAARGGRRMPVSRNDLGRLRPGDAPDAAGHLSSLALAVRPREGGQEPRVEAGPGALGKPRLILIITNLDSFATRRRASGTSVTTADLIVEGIKRFNPDLIIADEGHRLKSPSSNTSRALARVAKAVPRRLLLTGTVMPHSPLDVYGQWRFLAPEAFGVRDRTGKIRPPSFTRFRSRYAIMGGYMGYEVKGYRHLDEMKMIMARNAIVARKDDALDLPPTTDVTIRVDLAPGEEKAYRQMKEDLAARLSDGSLASAPNRLAQMMRLRQITSGFIHDTDSGITTDLGDSKAKIIRSIVQDQLAGEKRVVVFAHFRHELDLLEDRLTSKDSRLLRIDGDTPTSQRTRFRKLFGSDDPSRMILLAQTRTMSLAVNELVTASHAVYGSLSQQRDDLIQSRDRLNRVGQTRPVTYWYAVAPGTIDAVILKAHRDRTDLETAVLQHLSQPTKGS